MAPGGLQRTGCRVAALGWLCSATAAIAQPPIVVTASRTGKAGAATTVLDRHDLEWMQPVTVLDPLDRLAGVRAFSKGGLTYLSVRGGDPNFTLVLIDGVRVNDPTNSRGGAFDFEQIDPFALDGIEVARSALSAVHGADALSGVVHLRLREPDRGETAASARAFADTEGAAGLSGTAAHGWSGGGLVASVGWFDSGGLFEGVDLRRRQALAKASQDLGVARLSAFALHAGADRNAFPEDSGGPRLAAVREREMRETRLTVAGVEVGRAGEAIVQPRLALNWSRQDSETDTPPIAPGAVPGVPRIVSDSRFDRTEAIADLRLRATQTLTLAAGASLIREKGESSGFVEVGFPLPSDFSIERSIRSLFGEATLALRAASLTAGLRYDHASREGGAVTARGGVRLRLAPRTEAFADFSTGYKLPSLFALAFPVIANPDLEPERSRTLAFGVAQRLGGGEIRATLFESRFRNLIDFDVERFTNVNRGRVRSRGVELEAAIRLGPRTEVEGSLTWMDVDNAPGAPPLRSRPEWQGSMTLGWRPIERLVVSISGRFNSDYFDSSVPTGLILSSGHVRLDVEAVYRATERLALRATVRNIAAAEYEDALGFPAPRRLARLAVEWGF